MLNTVSPGQTIQASQVNALIQSVNMPNVTATNGLRVQSGGGSISIVGDSALRGDQTQQLPQLFSIKSGPSKKWVHKDSSGNVYPSLYVYLGPSPALALETVNISDNLIAEGDHPHIFLYFNLSNPSNWKTHAYEIDPQTGEPGSVFDPVPTNAASVRKCMIDSTDNSLDGWYELPTSPLNAMPIWAVCYVSFGVTPVLAFCTVDEIKTNIENTNSLSAVEMVAYEPNLSAFVDMSAIQGAGMYIGLVGSPIKLYDLNPYSTDPLSEKFDADGKVNDGYEWITLYAANNGLTFKNPTDNTAFSVKPCCKGSREKDHWKYWFYLSLPTPPKAPNSFDGGSPFTAAEISSCIKVQTIPERDGDVTLYTLPQIQRDGTTTVMQIASLSGKNRTDMGQNVEIVPTTTQYAPLCAKGSVMGLGFELLSSDEFDMALSGAVLFFLPVFMQHVTPAPFFVPRIVPFSTSSSPSPYPMEFIQNSPAFRACTIYPSGTAKSMQYRNWGNVPQYVGESIYTKYGQLTPPYASVSLLEMATQPNTDSQMEMRISQLASVLNGSALTGETPGMAADQYGSIMWNPHTKNVSMDGGETWEVDKDNPVVSYLELFGFDKFDISRKVNFSVAEAVQSVYPTVEETATRKDFDFVIRKRSDYSGGNNEGANIGYMRGFVPDTILDDNSQRSRSLEIFNDGNLWKDGVAHDALTLYDFNNEYNTQTIPIDLDHKRVSEGYGTQGHPEELNLVARYSIVGSPEKELNYLDIDFSWVVDSISALSDALGPFAPSGGGGGEQPELGHVIEDLSNKCDLEDGDFWVRGRDYRYCYGTSIGDSAQTAVISLNNKQLLGPWTCNDNFCVANTLSVNQLIKFYDLNPIAIENNNGDVYASEVCSLKYYDVGAETYSSFFFKHITATAFAIEDYTNQTADGLKALHDLIKAQAATIQSLQADVQSLQTAVQTLQQTVANHEQRLQNGGL